MSNFIIHNIKTFEKFEFHKTYILLIAIDNVPPHLAIVNSLRYFSLSSNGVKLGVDANIILNSLKRKNVSTVVLPLTINVDFNIVNAEYLKYQKLDKGHSCLTPIKDVIANIDSKLLNCKYAYDVIQYLYETNLIEEAFSLNYAKIELELLKYGQKEIDLAIYNAAQLC